ncbi:toll/interleukin-1 receptor domain-containing protein [Streptomyces sp. NPDC054796]
MPEVFINYRTGDGEKTAALIERELSHRFGEELIFRASKSIRPGQDYRKALAENVRRCSALLAVIGPAWLDAPDKGNPGNKALDSEDDWVRKEILEAFTCGLPVIPVLDGRSTERLNPRGLPPELARLANCQSLRLDTQQAETDLARIGDELALLIPRLAEAELSRGAPAAEPGDTHNTMGDVRGTGVQTRDVHGDIGGTVIRNPSGPVHAGTGGQYTDGAQHFSGNRTQHFHGDGTTNVEGDNHGGVSHSFGPRREPEGER